MRLPRLILVLATVLALTGCGRTVSGSALQDPDVPGVSLTADGFGIIAGRPDAPAQIEVYTEPQCTHCAHLQDTDGPEMKGLIALGLLTVTYRPVTFLDTAYGYSAKVAGAMFLAARGTAPRRRHCRRTSRHCGGTRAPGVRRRPTVSSRAGPPTPASAPRPWRASGPADMPSTPTR